MEFTFKEIQNKNNRVKRPLKRENLLNKRRKNTNNQQTTITPTHRYPPIDILNKINKTKILSITLKRAKISPNTPSPVQIDHAASLSTDTNCYTSTKSQKKTGNISIDFPSPPIFTLSTTTTSTVESNKLNTYTKSAQATMPPLENDSTPVVENDLTPVVDNPALSKATQSNDSNNISEHRSIEKASVIKAGSQCDSSVVPVTSTTDYNTTGAEVENDHVLNQAKEDIPVTTCNNDVVGAVRRELEEGVNLIDKIDDEQSVSSSYMSIISGSFSSSDEHMETTTDGGSPDLDSQLFIPQLCSTPISPPYTAHNHPHCESSSIEHEDRQIHKPSSNQPVSILRTKQSIKRGDRVSSAKTVNMILPPLKSPSVNNRIRNRFHDGSFANQVPKTVKAKKRNQLTITSKLKRWNKKNEANRKAKFLEKRKKFHQSFLKCRPKTKKDAKKSGSSTEELSLCPLVISDPWRWTNVAHDEFKKIGKHILFDYSDKDYPLDPLIGL